MISKAKARLRSLRGGSSSANASEASSRRAPKLVLLLGSALLASLVLGVALVGAAAPTVTVQDAAEVKYTTAHVSGTVDPQGQLTTYRFQYISEANYQQNLANSAPAFEGAGTGYEGSTSDPGPVSGEMTGLAPHTVYHLRLQADNEEGSNEAVASGTFETLDVDAPSVSIDPVTTFTGTTAHFTGTVNPNAPAGSLDQAAKDAYKTRWDFQCTPECPNLKGGFIEAEEGSKGVTADASGLDPNTTYQVKLVTSNAGGSESTAPVSFHTGEVAPEAETIPAFALGNGTEAQVGGRVNPRNTATTYWVEWGTTTSYGQSIPASKDASAGSGSTSSILTQNISGLTPGSEYHFRIVAENAAGETQGHDMSFEATPPAPAPESCGNETLRRENNSTELFDCRAYEQVSPTDKNGFDAGTDGERPVYVAANDGSALAFESFGGFADSVGAATINPYLSRRHDDGWATHAIGPPSAVKPSADFSYFNYYTPDLRQAVVRAAEGPALAPGATPGAVNFYLRNNDTDTYQTLNFGGVGFYYFAAATGGGKRILFESNAALTPDAPAGAASNLYEWNEGQLELVTIGPDGNPLPEGGEIEAGAMLNVTTHAISEDGSRVVFKGHSPEGSLYLREDGQQTIDISASQRSTPDPSLNFIAFKGATPDTSQIFFADTKALTDDAEVGEGNLYRYDANTKTLTNLTANPLPGSSARVDGVAAISEDGSYVYFRSSSRFVSGEGDGQSNLYLWHNGTISLVALDNSDGEVASRILFTTYRLSANSRYLTFTTSARLTAYDNTDAVSGEPDEEVYRYDAISKRLTCVSCNPDGLAPHGGSVSLSPAPRQPRNSQVVSTPDGRVFFSSRDSLVPSDVNGKKDAYEWKEGRPYLVSSGTDGDPSFYVGASEDGRDVFFATRERLIPADRDQLLDVYDARSGGGFAQPVLPGPCEGAEGCHGPARSAPGLASPASSSLGGGGQPSPSAERLKAARRACNRKPKKARAKCRAKAKKRFTKAGRAH